MRRLMTGGVALAIALAGCGSSHTAATKDLKGVKSSAQTKQAESYAKGVAIACINKGGGWRKEIRCAIPKGHGRQFVTCAFQGAPKNIKDQNAVESDLVKCGERYR